MLEDILQETPAYKQILRRGEEKGREEGREEGQLEALRQTVVDVIIERFPQLLRLARKQVAVVDSPTQLRHLVVKISIAQNIEEARRELLAVDEEQEEI